MWVPLVITNNFCIDFLCQKCHEGLDLDPPFPLNPLITPNTKVFETMPIWVFR